MNQTAIGWIALAIAALVYLDLLFVELRRIVREGLRIVRRVGAYADLPVIAQAAETSERLERMNDAFDRIDPLLARAQAALATIRDPLTPFWGAYDPLVPKGSDASKGFSVD